MYIKNLFIQKPKNTGFYYKLSNILKLHNLVFIIKNSVTTTMKQIHMASVSVTTIVFWGWWGHLGFILMTKLWYIMQYYFVHYNFKACYTSGL